MVIELDISGNLNEGEASHLQERRMPEMQFPTRDEELLRVSLAGELDCFVSCG